VLLVLNGAPGVGKSALARRYAEEHALALVIDIDDLRRTLGQWEEIEASRSVARDLAIALARAHLGAGYDVIVPQYLGRREFVERLRVVAEAADARFLEVTLSDDADTIVERFRDRRRELSALGIRHPEADLSEADVAATLGAATDDLRRDALIRGEALIHMGAGIDACYRALCDAISGT
jgi:predicted kinase